MPMGAYKNPGRPTGSDIYFNGAVPNYSACATFTCFAITVYHHDTFRVQFNLNNKHQYFPHEFELAVMNDGQ